MTTKVHPSKINSANLVSLDGLTLAEGDLLYATGVGTLAKLAKGTAGQVLRRNLAGDGYDWVSVAAGGWVTIASDTLADQASWTAINLSAYRKLRITGFIRPATDAVLMLLRTSTNNGSSYDAGATDYRWQIIRGAGATPDGLLDEDDTSFRFSYVGVGNVTQEEGVQFEILMDQFNQTTRTWCTASVLATNSIGVMSKVEFGGQRLALTACNAIQITADIGNLSFGQILLEGLVS